MFSMKRWITYLPLAFVFWSFLVPLPCSYVRDERSSVLRDGIEQYRRENYEEAVELLIKAREQDPRSAARPITEKWRAR